ncbi:unnamed protein product [Rhizophagus irregularis]|nr:unnamed protein product [Rhizophagus irregularis]
MRSEETGLRLRNFPRETQKAVKIYKLFEKGLWKNSGHLWGVRTEKGMNEPKRDDGNDWLKGGKDPLDSNHPIHDNLLHEEMPV